MCVRSRAFDRTRGTCHAQTPENAKIILANAVSQLPQSVNIWLDACELEQELGAKKRVLRKALEYVVRCLMPHSFVRHAERPHSPTRSSFGARPFNSRPTPRTFASSSPAPSKSFPPPSNSGSLSLELKRPIEPEPFSTKLAKPSLRLTRSGSPPVVSWNKRVPMSMR